MVDGGANTANFIHPGITHKISDLDRMRYMVEAQIDPWFSSYQDLTDESRASFDYEVQGDPSMTEIGRDNGVNYGAWNSDIRAAYYNALRWYIEQDERFALKAVEIFNAWSGVESVTSNGTTALSGGVGYIMIEAAEIIKNTYDGWAEADQDAFRDMLVFPGLSRTEVPDGIDNDYGSFYWQSYRGDPGRHGNQGLSAWRTIMAMGIFLDDRVMYQRALRYILGLPHLEEDLPYPSGPPTSHEVIGSNDYADTHRATGSSDIEDYGFNEVMTNYIWENGQCQESSRDQQHTFFGIGLLTSMAEMAWNQGDDLYSHEDDRLLLGLEYNMRFNVSHDNSFPDQEDPWVPTVESDEFLQKFDRTGRWFSKAMSPIGVGAWAGSRPVFELAVAHYSGRGFKTDEELKWTQRARDIAIETNGYEEAGHSNDALGWGALNSRRPAGCHGDPISGFDEEGQPVFAMNVVPTTIEAENFDYSPVSGEGRIYSDTTSDNAAGVYRGTEGVDVSYSSEGGYMVGDTAAGEWLTYTVYVPVAGEYDVSLRYSASASGAAVSVSFDGAEGSPSVPAPATGGEQEWDALVVATGLTLEPGVQVMRITIESGGLNLGSVTVE